MVSVNGNIAACVAGEYGIDCLKKCGNCNDGTACGFKTGHCDKGCSPGYEMPFCKQGMKPLDQLYFKLPLRSRTHLHVLGM